MVLPIHGPFVRTDSTASAFRQQWRYLQKRPYTEPAPYQGRVRKRLSWDGVDPSLLSEQWVPWGAPNNVKIIAYDRFKDKLGSQAELGVTFLEMNQSLLMIRNRLLQLAYVVRALKKGHIDDAWAHLKQPGVIPRRVRPGSEHWANNYLEFHFGWAPAVGDIYNAINVLQNGIPPRQVKASAYGSSFSSYTPDVDYARGYDFGWISRVRYQAEVSINNANLHLANQLGLTNPLVWAYEKVPFSFVADWFFNVSQFFSLGTDFMGLTLSKPMTTQMNHGTVAFRWTTYGWHSEFYEQTLIRSLGIEQPAFGLRPFKLWGWRRTASAAALMTLLLPKRKK